MTRKRAISGARAAMDLCDLALPYVRSIAQYQPGKPISELEREFGISNAIKLASNENPLGPSPAALQAARKALADLARYPDGNGFDLKRALSEQHQIDPERIVLGNGSNDVLELVARGYLAPGLNAVYSEHAFAVYPLVTQAVGAGGIQVPAKDYGHDLDAMRSAFDDQTRIVFIANPNNPTGTFVEAPALRAFLESAPGQVLVVLDEAYHEYLPDPLKPNSVGWLSEFSNLVITRTFSKAHGLAGLRVGYALAHPSIADVMNRVRQPFNVNAIALAAASAALEDQGFVSKSRHLNAVGMEQLTMGFSELKVGYIPSRGNFVCFEAYDAATVYQRLLRLGVIVRPVAGYGLPSHLRVSVGLEEENSLFLKALKQALQA